MENCEKRAVREVEEIFIQCLTHSIESNRFLTFIELDIYKDGCEKSFKKFYGRYQDLIEKYQRSVNVMVNDSFPG